MSRGAWAQTRCEDFDVGSLISSLGASSQLVRNYRENTERGQRALERLSTGKRINRPSDDPSGFVTAENLRGEIVRLQAELKSIGGNRTKTRIEESGLANIQDQLMAVRGLLAGTIGAGLSDDERQAYEQEIVAGLEAVDRLREQLADQSARSGSGRPGSTTKLSTLDVTDVPAMAKRVDENIDSVVWSRAALAAYEKYNLDGQETLLRDEIAIHTEALSQVEDADYAEESANMAQAQTLADGSLAALALTQRVAIDQISELMDGMRDAAPASPPA